MIRSTCAALFALVLATAFITSPQSSEAKDRRCQPRCCQPPVCCQPAATCCQPRPTCCQSQPIGTLDVDYICPYWKWATWDDGMGHELYCSFMAVRCSNFFPEMLDASCDNGFSDCPTHSTACVTETARLTSSGRGRQLFGHSHKPGTKMPRLIPAGRKPNLHPNADYKFEFVGQHENQPLFVKFATKNGATCYFQLRIYRHWKKTPSQPDKLLGDFGVGQECTQPPNPDQLPALTEGVELQVKDKNVAIVILGGTQYQVTTNTPLK